MAEDWDFDTDRSDPKECIVVHEQSEQALELLYTRCYIEAENLARTVVAQEDAAVPAQILLGDIAYEPGT